MVSIGLELDVIRGLENVIHCAHVDAQDHLQEIVTNVLIMLIRMIWRNVLAFIIEEGQNERFTKENVTGTVNGNPVMDPLILIVKDVLKMLIVISTVNVHATQLGSMEKKKHALFT